jgi:pimeloyl-ACP methyl ester carboxylesterase
MRMTGLLIAIAILLSGCGEPAEDKAQHRQPVPQQQPAPPPVRKLWETRPPAPPLPHFDTQTRVEHDGAKIWVASVGTGTPVILLHGAFGNAENFGNQVPALLKSGHRVILIDSRGQGHSTRDARPFTYELMESDVVAVMNALKLDKAAIVGWSDGAIIGLVMAMKHPKRVTRVFAFGANMDQSGAMSNLDTQPIFDGFLEQAAKDYARLSDTPGDFQALSEAIYQMLLSQPNYTAKDLASIRGPRIAIVDGEREEVIKPEHTKYLASTIPGAKLIILPNVSHWAPLQDPAAFNAAMLTFLDAP